MIKEGKTLPYLSLENQTGTSSPPLFLLYYYDIIPLPGSIIQEVLLFERQKTRSLNTAMHE